MNILLTFFFFSFVIFLSVSILLINNYIQFIILINKNKDKLNLPKNIKGKLAEYWGLNILRQNHDIWDEIGSKLSDGKLLSLWKKVDQYYEILKKILFTNLILVVVFIVFFVIFRGN